MNHKADRITKASCQFTVLGSQLVAQQAGYGEVGRKANGQVLETWPLGISTDGVSLIVSGHRLQLRRKRPAAP